MTHTSISSRVILLGVFALFAGSTLLVGAPQAHASSIPITGYAWSGSLGWLHFDGIGYGVYEDSLTGALSGYAWSPFYGYVTFNAADVVGCPSGTCAPSVNLTTGAVTGWARSCAAFANKNACSGALDAGAGGWDGWIHLSSSNYGITSGADGCWTGWAYGGQNIGYIHLSGTATDNSTYKVCGAPTPTTASLNVSSNSVAYGGTVTISWGSGGGATSCSSTGFTSGSTSGSKLSNSLTTDTTFTLTCTGPGGDSTLQSQTVTVDAPVVPTASLNATPDTIDVGQSTLLTWTSSNASSCVSSGGFDTGGEASNVTGISVSPIVTSSYGITCTGLAGTTTALTTVTVLQPNVSISARPTRVAVNTGTTVISWSSSQVTSCAVTRNGAAWKTGLNSTSTPDTNLTTQTTYKITCQTLGSPLPPKSVIVNVEPVFTEF